MEFILSTDIQKELPKEIQFNFQELEMELSKQLEKYNNITITEDDIKAAKVDRANLNKLKEALESNRKSVKSLYLAPYELFAEKIKKLTDLIEKPIQTIDKQLKEYDRVRKDKKVIEIQKIHNEMMGDLKELVPLEKIWNAKWLNASFKLSDIESEIEVSKTHIEEGLKIIEELKSENLQQMKSVFFDTLNISKALAEDKRLKDLKAKQAEYEIKQAEKQQQLLESQAVKEAQGNVHTIAQDTAKKEAVQEETVLTVDFRVTVTVSQMQALKEFLVSNHIQYGRVPKCQETA